MVSLPHILEPESNSDSCEPQERICVYFANDEPVRERPHQGQRDQVAGSLIQPSPSRCWRGIIDHVLSMPHCRCPCQAVTAGALWKILARRFRLLFYTLGRQGLGMPVGGIISLAPLAGGCRALVPS